jgi:DNA primase
MKLPQSFTEEIKNRLRISEVIGGYIQIKRAGREYKACCPFHNEKTPSFTINDEKGFYHCFGCGAHGNVIGFVKEYERLGYMEAVRKLADMSGLQMPQVTPEMAAREDKNDALRRIMEQAARWFEAQLHQSQEGDIARTYLSERGLRPDIVAQFRLGYAPQDRQAIARMAEKAGISQSQMIALGLLIQVEGRTPYSRFRRRLIFPIRDHKGQVVGFGGRVLPQEPNPDAPKYLNSPETPLFHKGKLLYNLDISRQEAVAKQRLLIAEGYMDVIAFHQAGYKDAVAPLGTAITEDQLMRAWKMVDMPILCLDGDNAGDRAVQRAVDLALPLLAPGKSLRIARMPKGEDPDSVLRHMGTTAMNDILDRASPLVEQLWRYHMSIPATTPEGRAAQESALMRSIQRINHPQVQHHYRQTMRERLREAASLSLQTAGKKAFSKVAVEAKLPDLPPPTRDTAQALRGPVEKLLALALADPSLIQEGSAQESWLLAPASEGAHDAIHQAITVAVTEGVAISHDTLSAYLQDTLDPAHYGVLTRAMASLGITPKMDEMGRKMHAARLWPEVLNDIHLIRLRAELKQAEQELAVDCSEENMARWHMFRAQVDAVQQERSKFYQEDPVTHTAEA